MAWLMSRGLAGPGIVGRHQRRRVVVDLGDQPQAILDVKRPRLLGDVGGGVVEVEKRGEVLSLAFRDHPSGAVLHESIDHDPVVDRDIAHALRRHPAQVHQGNRAIQPGDHILDGGERIGGELIGDVRLFELQDQRLVAAVKAGVERTIGRDAHLGVEQVARFEQRQVVAQRPQCFGLLRAEYGRDGMPQELVRGCAQQTLDVARHLEDLQRGAIHHQHRAMGQNGARDMDRLPVAIGDVGWSLRGNNGAHGVALQPLGRRP
jgi:hypothetical protein